MKGGQVNKKNEAYVWQMLWPTVFGSWNITQELVALPLFACYTLPLARQGANVLTETAPMNVLGGLMWDSTHSSKFWQLPIELQPCTCLLWFFAPDTHYWLELLHHHQKKFSSSKDKVCSVQQDWFLLWHGSDWEIGFIIFWLSGINIDGPSRTYQSSIRFNINKQQIQDIQS